MLTTINNIKTRLGIDLFDTESDALLTSIANLVTGQVEAFCRRTFARADAITEEFPGYSLEITPSRYPIESVTKWERKSSESTGWQELFGVDYNILQSCVISLPVQIGISSDQLRITYSAGYVLPGDTVGTGQTALPTDLESAVIEECCRYYQAKDRLGLVSQWDREAGWQTMSAKEQFMPQTRVIFAKYRRLML